MPTTYAPRRLSTVATTGSYDDLNDKPAIPATAADVGAAPVSHSHAAVDVVDFGEAAAAAAPVQSVNGQTGAVVVSDGITDAGAQSTSYAVDFAGNAVVLVSLTGDVAFSATGLSTRSRTIQVEVTASGGARSPTFPADWKWVGQKPTSIASGASGLLTLTNVGSAATDVRASWQDLGDGS